MSLDLGDVPTWFGGASAFFAFGAAALAARWTAKTAKAAEQQVAELRKQVAADIGQLELARKDAEQQAQAREAADKRALAAEERERVAAQAAEERFVKAQLDTRAPAVYIRATPGAQGRNSAADPLPALGILDRSNGYIDWDSLPTSVVSELYVESTENPIFVRYVTFYFVNCSDIPARVDIVDRSSGEFIDMQSGQDIILPPGEKRHLVWRGIVDANLLRMEGAGKSEYSILHAAFWVRDLGFNVKDPHLFNLDLRYFENDGSRLKVAPKPVYAWSEKYGEVGVREYEKLEAEKQKSNDGSL